MAILFPMAASTQKQIDTNNYFCESIWFGTYISFRLKTVCIFV